LSHRVVVNGDGRRDPRQGPIQFASGKARRALVATRLEWEKRVIEALGC
jgi:hypothetical protein